MLDFSDLLPLILLELNLSIMIYKVVRDWPAAPSLPTAPFLHVNASKCSSSAGSWTAPRLQELLISLTFYSFLD